MILTFDNFRINILTKGQVKSKKAIIFLHGFTGSASDWENVFRFIPANIFCVAIDLPGHGESSSPEELKYYSLDWICRMIEFVSGKMEFEKFCLCGYSMGGRAALNYSVNYPERVEKLILESATAGIESETDRKTRINSDNMLCSIIENQGVRAFIDYWMNLDMFADLKDIDEESYLLMINRKKKNSSQGLINSLRAFGTGTMNPLWEKLFQIKIPTLLITGTLDKKFTNINNRMNKILANSRHKIINNCGHNVHAKNPKEFSELLINFVQ
jgi:2-succinyl-6-hydroxy-2,4-cyclohexadiene-1-carboxylate synthase